jgi:uroporphyrin-III C-methyltransferase/precorrin-2 dehydrogenase/sirohydrochlorin ferrochelatase
VIAIGTGGSAPVLARLLRGRIEALLPAHFGELAALSAAVRGEVQARLPDVNARRRFWENAFEGEVAELVFRGQRDAAERALRAQLTAAEAPARTGMLYLIGAGTGDPELVTFRALRFLQRADLVLAAPGVAPAIIDLARRDATRVELAESPLTAADAAVRRVLPAVQAGQRACVLAPGDAFREPGGSVFAAALDAHALRFEIIPGVATT